MLSTEKANNRQPPGLPRAAGLSLSEMFCTENHTATSYRDSNALPQEDEKLSYDNSHEAKFVALCKQLKKKPTPPSDAEKKELQRLFAYCLDNISGKNQQDTEKRRMFFCFNMLAFYPNLLQNFDDMTRIFNLVSQKNRAWIKICVTQALKNNFKLLEENESSNSESSIEWLALINSLETAVKSLQKSIAKIAKETYKKPLFEKKLEEQLAQLQKGLQQLETIKKQFNITGNTALEENLTALDLELSNFINQVKEAGNYINFKNEFDALFTGALTQLAQHKKSGWHNAALDIAYVASEMANIGLVLQEVVGGLSRNDYWLNLGTLVGHYSNPLIYAFKAVQRGLKVIGRRCGLEFSEDESGVNPKQDRADLFAAGTFIVITALLLAGTLAGLPILELIAWGLAPLGLGVVWKSEYGYQNQRAAERLQNMEKSDGLFDKETQKRSKKIAQHKKIASTALVGVIVFITLGMLATLLGGFPATHFLFAFVSVKDITMVTGGALALLALTRALNFLVERGIKESLKAVGHYLYQLPGNIWQFSKKIIPSLIESFKNFLDSSPYNKAAVIFTLAALAITIFTLTGGIGFFIGCGIAVGLQIFASIAKSIETYKNRNRMQIETEKANPIKSSDDFDNTISILQPKTSVADTKTSVDDTKKSVDDTSVDYRRSRRYEDGRSPTTNFFATSNEADSNKRVISPTDETNPARYRAKTI